MVRSNVEGPADCTETGAITQGGNVTPRSSLSASIKSSVLDKREYIDDIAV